MLSQLKTLRYHANVERQSQTAELQKKVSKKAENQAVCNNYSNGLDEFHEDSFSNNKIKTNVLSVTFTVNLCFAKLACLWSHH